LGEKKMFESDPKVSLADKGNFSSKYLFLLGVIKVLFKIKEISLTKCALSLIASFTTFSGLSE